jgi:hypothetical protein
MTAAELCDAIDRDTAALVERIDERLARIDRMLAERTIAARWRAARDRLTAERQADERLRDGRA